MNIGDKVRFLNDVGGGVIAGFQGKDIVIVRDSDGFEVPTMRKEVVVIETDAYNFEHKTPKPKPAVARGPAKAAAQQGAQVKAASPELADDPADRPLTFHAKPLERRGANRLNIFLGFVPMNIKEVTNTAFEAYFINDSNYYVRYVILTQEGQAYQLRHEGVAEPNTKNFLEEFKRDALGELERLTVQLMAYKTDKPFGLKPTMTVALRIDGTKFYKLHTFQTSDFFSEPSLVVDVVRDDRPAKSVLINPEELQDAMARRAPERRNTPQPARQTANKNDRNAIIEVDLHAEELLDTTAGLEAKDILEYQLKTFRETMNAHLKEKGRHIVFIHGKGEGVLRNALLKELKAHYRQCSYQDASFREYGFGATMITIH